MGNGSTKYLDSNRNNDDDPQNSNHQAVFVSTAQSASVVTAYIGVGAGSVGGATHIGSNSSNFSFFRSRTSATAVLSLSAASTGLIGMSRASSSNFSYRAAGASAVSNTASQTPFNGNVVIFNRVTTTGFVDARLAFYSIGESLNLALLDARVTTLINAFAAAIP